MTGRFTTGCLTVTLCVMAVAVVPAQSKPDGKSEGIVYDIDYLGAVTQVLLRDSNRTALPALETTSNAIQDLLRVSFETRRPVRVEFVPGKPRPSIERATLEDRTATTEGRVQKITCDMKNVCTSDIWQSKQLVTVSSDSLRANGVLMTGISQSIPVEYLKYSSKNVIERVKINAESK